MFKNNFKYNFYLSIIVFLLFSFVLFGGNSIYANNMVLEEDLNIINQESLINIEDENKVIDEHLLKLKELEDIEDFIEYTKDMETIFVKGVKVIKGEYHERSNEKNINKDNPFTEKEVNLMFATTIKALVNLDVKDYVLKDITMYISPYPMSDSSGYANLSNKKITIATKGGNIGNNTMKYYEILSTVNHELGHIALVNIEEEIIKNSKDKNFEILDYYSTFYDEFEPTIINNVKKYSISDSWSDDIHESFAEDFRVYVSNRNKEDDRKSYNKKTNQKYNISIDNFFNKHFN